jgi:TolA-binding protein
MSAAAKALPVGWSKILDEIHLRLDQAITSANARIESMPSAEPMRASEERLREIAQWSDRLRRLSVQLESAEQIVQSVEELLQHEESRMKHVQSNCATLRQRLAEGTGRAIG